jgi:hypothetical protein
MVNVYRKSYVLTSATPFGRICIDRLMKMVTNDRPEK